MTDQEVSNNKSNMVGLFSPAQIMDYGRSVPLLRIDAGPKRMLASAVPAFRAGSDHRLSVRVRRRHLSDQPPGPPGWVVWSAAGKSRTWTIPLEV
jgi:hypothetical protein